MRDRDESYVIDLCDRVLRLKANRQHRFDFLRGDSGRTCSAPGPSNTTARAITTKLRVDRFTAKRSAPGIECQKRLAIPASAESAATTGVSKPKTSAAPATRAIATRIHPHLGPCTSIAQEEAIIN